MSLQNPLVSTFLVVSYLVLCAHVWHSLCRTTKSAASPHTPHRAYSGAAKVPGAALRHKLDVQSLQKRTCDRAIGRLYTYCLSHDKLSFLNPPLTLVRCNKGVLALYLGRVGVRHMLGSIPPCGPHGGNLATWLSFGMAWCAKVQRNFNGDIQRFDATNSHKAQHKCAFRFQFQFRSCLNSVWCKNYQ